MQYVGRAIGTVSKTWNSINPATLSGAIDIIVVERDDGEYDGPGRAGYKHGDNHAGGVDGGRGSGYERFCAIGTTGGRR